VHIRRVCHGYAERGYHAVAPALFDRARPGVGAVTGLIVLLAKKILMPWAADSSQKH
jgi:dienelactone hydrolase